MAAHLTSQDQVLFIGPQELTGPDGIGAMDAKASDRSVQIEVATVTSRVIAERDAGKLMCYGSEVEKYYAVMTSKKAFKNLFIVGKFVFACAHAFL